MLRNSQDGFLPSRSPSAWGSIVNTLQGQGPIYSDALATPRVRSWDADLGLWVPPWVPFRLLPAMSPFVPRPLLLFVDALLSFMLEVFLRCQGLFGALFIFEERL